MKRTLTFLAASTAIVAVLGVPAWSAMRTTPAEGQHPVAALFQEALNAPPLRWLVDDHDDDGHWRTGSWRGHHDDDDDHDHDDDDDDGCDDDDLACRAGGPGSAGNPAPAGTVAPPKNGLFGNGAPPRAQVN